MARVRGPLMSMEASGNFAGQMQFRCNRYGGHVYRPPDPTTQNQRPATQSQSVVRQRYRSAVAAWRALSEQDRNGWRAQGSAMLNDVSGWNLFLAAFDGTQPPVIGPYQVPSLAIPITLQGNYTPPLLSLPITLI